MMTCDGYRDGTVRKLPTLKVERVTGGYLVTLQDHASRQQISALCNTLAEMPEALEKAMRGSDPQWRYYKSQVVRDVNKREKRKTP